MLKLVFTCGHTQTRSVPIDQDAFVIGREQECDLVLDDSRVSRRHCRIDKSPLGYRLADLASANGICVNGIFVKEHLLRPGDMLQIGSTDLRVVEEVPSKCAPAIESVEQVRNVSTKWIFCVLPRRPVYHCITLALLVFLSGIIALSDFSVKTSHDTGRYWSDWSRRYFNIGLALEYYGFGGEKGSRNDGVLKNPGQKEDEHCVVSTQRENRGIGADNVVLNRDRKRTEDIIVEKDISPEENLLRKAKSEDLYRQMVQNALENSGIHLNDKMLDGIMQSPMMGKIRASAERFADSKQERDSDKNNRGQSFGTFEAEIRNLIETQRFAEAEALIENFGLDKKPVFEDSAVAKLLRDAKNRYSNTVAPDRRNLYGVVVTAIAPFLMKRDYAGAVGKIESLARDVRWRDHASLLQAEKERLATIARTYEQITAAIRILPLGRVIAITTKDGQITEGKFYEVRDNIAWFSHARTGTVTATMTGSRFTEITVRSMAAIVDNKDIPPLQIADLYLSEMDYRSAYDAAVDAIAENFSTVSDFFIRMDLFQKALIDEEIRKVFARADKEVANGKPMVADNILKTFAEGYAVPTMEGVALPERSSLPEGIALHDGRLPQLDAVAKKREEIQAKITIGNPQVGNIPYHRLKILGEKEQAEEKLTLLKSLKVVGGKEILPCVIRSLDDDSARVRLEAVRTLIAIGDGANTWDLAKMSDDPVPEVAQTALDGLDKIGARPDIIREKFASGGPGEKRLAVKVAGSIGEKKLGTMVREGLGHGDWRVRKESAIAVAKLKAKNAGNALVTALKTERFDAVEAAIAYALGAIKHTGGIAPLADLLKRKPNHPFKREILRAIGATGGSESTKVLLGYLRDMNPWNRYEAVNGLAENHAKVSDEDVKHLLVDDRWLVRAGAISAMIGGENDKSLDTIVKSLDDAHQAVRATAHDGLLYWKNARVIPAIVKEIKGMSGEGLGLAQDILKRLTGQSFATAAEWERWWKINGSTFQLLPPAERFKPRDGGKKE